MKILRIDRWMIKKVFPAQGFNDYVIKKKIRFFPVWLTYHWNHRLRDGVMYFDSPEEAMVQLNWLANYRYSIEVN